MLDGTSSCQVAVIGAGPAGSAAALTLGRAGVHVLLMDRARFPRDKTCGDGITGPGLHQLELLGLGGVAEQAGGVSHRAIRFTIGDEVAEVPYADGARGMVRVVRRRELDDRLAQAAAGLPTVHFVTGVEVTGFDLDGPGPRLHVRSDEGTTEELTVPALIDASGALSRIAREVGMFHRRDPLPLAVQSYWTGVPGLRDALEFHFGPALPGGYLWIFPSGGGTANVGCGSFWAQTPKALVGEVERFLAEHEFGAQLRRGRRTRAWRGGFIPVLHDLRSRGRPGVLFAGDAGRFCDPLFGEGIRYALESGVLAAEELLRHDLRITPETIACYDERWQESFGDSMSSLFRLLLSRADTGSGFDQSRYLEAVRAGVREFARTMVGVSP